MPKNTAPTPEQDKKTGRFVAGNSGNGGRRKGSRNKLGEAFLSDMLADWSENGKQAIETVRQEKPDAYLKVVASILPKQMDVNVNQFDGVSDEELRKQVKSIARDLGALAAIGVGGDADGVEAPTRH